MRPDSARMTSWRAVNRISAPLRRVNVPEGTQYGVVLPNVIFRMLNPGKPVPKNEVGNLFKLANMTRLLSDYLLPSIQVHFKVPLDYNKHQIRHYLEQLYQV